MASQQEIRSTISLFGRVDSSVGALARTLDSIGRTTERIGGALSTFSIPIIAAGKASLDLYTTYDDVMKSIQAVGGYTAEEMEVISDAARKAGAETRFMATDAGSALLYLTQAGVDMQGSLEVLPALLDAAAAGQMDLATTSDLLISNIYSLGKTFNEADVSTYVDAVTMAADATNTNLEEIMSGVSKVGAAGRMFGGGTEELLTFMGLLSNLNLKGETGGINARNMVISLLAPTDKAGKMMEALAITEEEMGEALDGVNLEDSAKMMQTLGLETVDAQGKVRPMIDILTDLNGALSGMSDDEVANTLYTIFGKRTYPAVAGLLELLNLYPDVLEQVQNSAGSAAEKAEIMESGIGGTTRRLKSAWEELKLSIGEAISPTVTSAMEILRDVFLGIADAVDSLDPATAENITKLLGGIAAAGPGLMIAGKGISAVSAVLSALTTPTGKVLAIAAAFGALAWAIDSAQDAAVEKSLEEHFGNIEVDAEKMQGIIAGLAGDFETKAAGLTAYAEAIDTASTNYQGAVSALSGGLLEAYFTQTELNETDKQSLMYYAESMVTSLKEAIGTQKLQVADIIDLSFDGTEEGDAQKNAGWDALADEIFGDLETEAKAVGENMRKQMVAALQDGTLNEDELEAIRASQKRMNEIMAQINKMQGDYAAKTAYNKAMLMSYDSIDAQMAAVDEAEAAAKQTIADSYASMFALLDIAEERGEVLSPELQAAYGISATDYAGARAGLMGDYNTEIVRANADRTMLAARIASEAFNAYGEEMEPFFALVDQIASGELAAEEALSKAYSTHGGFFRKDKADSNAVEKILSDMNEHMPLSDLTALMDYQMKNQGYVDEALSGLYRDYLAASFYTGGSDFILGPDENGDFGLNDDNLGSFGTADDIGKYLQMGDGTAVEIPVKLDTQAATDELNTVGEGVQPVKILTQVKSESGGEVSDAINDAMGEPDPLEVPAQVDPDGTAATNFMTDTQTTLDSAGLKVEVELPDGIDKGEDFALDVQDALTDNPGSIKISTPDGFSAGMAFAAQVQSALDSNPASITISGGYAGGASGGTGSGASAKKSSGGGILSTIKSVFGFAEGGRASVPSIFGEAGPEWAIPEEHTQRTAQLLASAAKASGFSMSELIARTGGLGGNVKPTSSFVYSPTIYASDTRGVKRALEEDKEELEALFEAFMRQKERVSYA